MQRSNDGVAARANADRLALKQTAPDGSERLAESAAALERKAALYGRLARGEAQDEGEAYEVGLLGAQGGRVRLQLPSGHESFSVHV
jgi:hypothetical protein